MPQQTQLTGWRAHVRDWLAAVVQQQAISFHRDFREAATQLKTSFPQSFWVALAAQFVRPLATWIVSSAVRGAANDLGLTMNDETVSFLSELAVDVLTTTP
jgi:hypothetical protein